MPVSKDGLCDFSVYEAMIFMQAGFLINQLRWCDMSAVAGGKAELLGVRGQR